MKTFRENEASGIDIRKLKRREEEDEYIFKETTQTEDREELRKIK
jgi:hypothetical protein